MKNVLKLRWEQLNNFLGGGLEKGIITNVYGVAGAGKTNFALETVIAALLDDKKAIFVDTERNFSPERFLQMHPKEEDLERVIIFEPFSFQEQHEVITKKLPLILEEEKSKIGVVVVDSMVSLYRLEMKHEKAQEINAMLSEQFVMLAKIAKHHSIPVLVTCQVYTPFDSDELEIVGRDIPKYSSKCMILLEKKDYGIRKATLIKHRYMPEGTNIELKITNKGLEPSESRKFSIFK